MPLCTARNLHKLAAPPAFELGFARSQMNPAEMSAAVYFFPLHFAFPVTMSSDDTIRRKRMLADQLESLHLAGVLQIPKPTRRVRSAEKDTMQAATSLEVLHEQVVACTRCNELVSTRTQTVFGVGNPHPRICFLGEAPGADEDRTGIPFVGRAGQLLTKIIEACQLTRDEVYILNMLKCRPPNNRNPLPHELGNCRGFLEAQLELLRPEYICCLGAVASQNLLETTESIGKLRGRFHVFRGAKVVCTYHPAFLLRSPSFKKETWEDMKMLLRDMGVNL
ncbi:MAG: uracil-DNA glycosylase [Pirellulales bacterium]|nr:uracil-DNA glycosylase [Pirellulales bacterium]